MMSEIGKNIRQLRESGGYSQEWLANQTGKTRSAISQYEAGKIIPRMGVIEDLASVFGVDKSAILGETGSISYVNVPLYGTIAAGEPIEMIEVNDFHPVPTVVRARYPKAFLLRVEGDSMNRILPNGCYALVDPCEIVDRSGQPYAVCVNGYDATIKRVRLLNNGVELIPDSNDPTYKSVIYDFGVKETENVTVIGRVVYYVLPFDWDF